VKFLIDAQLPPLLAEWLREQGHDADHVYDLGGLSLDDEAIWTLALERGCVVVTKDRDFAEWAFARSPAPRVLWLRFGNTRNSALKRQMAAAWPRIAGALKGDGIVVEAR
jgi:predicted nuclease of predicted toxin-antitoxin system